MVGTPREASRRVRRKRPRISTTVFLNDSEHDGAVKATPEVEATLLPEHVGLEWIEVAADKTTVLDDKMNLGPSRNLSHADADGKA